MSEPNITIRYKHPVNSLEDFSIDITNALKNRLAFLDPLDNVHQMTLFETLKSQEGDKINDALEVFYKFKELAEKKVTIFEQDRWSTTRNDLQSKEINLVSKMIAKANQTGGNINPKFERKLQKRINQIHPDKYGNIYELDQYFHHPKYSSRKENESPVEIEARMIPLIMYAEKCRDEINTSSKTKKGEEYHTPNHYALVLSDISISLQGTLASIKSNTISEKTHARLENLSASLHSSDNPHLRYSGLLLNKALTGINVKKNKEAILQRLAEKKKQITTFENNKNKKFYTADDLEFAPPKDGYMSATMHFENGWGVMVLNRVDEAKWDSTLYTVGILDKEGHFNDDTNIGQFTYASDKEDLNEIMKAVQMLDKDGKYTEGYSEADNAISGVVVADKIAKMKQDGDITASITPKIGQKLSQAIKREYLMKKKQRG